MVVIDYTQCWCFEKSKHSENTTTLVAFFVRWEENKIELLPRINLISFNQLFTCTLFIIAEISLSLNQYSIAMCYFFFKSRLTFICLIRKLPLYKYHQKVTANLILWDCKKQDLNLLLDLPSNCVAYSGNCSAIWGARVLSCIDG